MIVIGRVKQLVMVMYIIDEVSIENYQITVWFVVPADEVYKQRNEQSGRYDEW